MRDRYFYPLAIVVIVGIVIYALLPGRSGAMRKSDQEILNSGYHLSGAELRRLTAADGTVINFRSDDAGNVSSAILLSSIPVERAPLSAGVFATLGNDYERMFGGRELKISVNARAGNLQPLERFKFGYFTAGAGDSGWNEFTLGPEYEEFNFRYSPKRPTETAGYDYVGIWPGDKGDRHTMEIDSLKIEIVRP